MNETEIEDRKILEDLTEYAKHLAKKHCLQNSEQVNKRMIRMILTQLSWKIEDIKEASK